METEQNHWSKAWVGETQQQGEGTPIQDPSLTAALVSEEKLQFITYKQNE